MPNNKWDDEKTQLERRLELQRLLHASPGGFTAAELSEKLTCSIRTVQRDLDYFRSLLEETGVFDALIAKSDRYKLEPGQFPLPLLKLTPDEARALLFSLRMLSQRSTEQDADAASLLNKLAAVFPGSLAQQIAFTRDSVQQRPADPAQTERLHALTRAWLREETVIMRYQAVGRDTPSSVCFEPYVLEPSATSGATYVIGYNHNRRLLGTYKFDRILRIDRHHKTLCSDSVDQHPATDRQEAATLMDRITQSWSGVVLSDGDHEIVVEFEGDAAIRARETRWHPNTSYTDMGNGRTRMTTRLPAVFDFVPFVLSWGGSATVISPPELIQMVEAARQQK